VNPGRGWVMVRAAQLTPKAIAEAMDRGEFYASSGVVLKDVRVDEKEYRVVVDDAATRAEVSKPELVPRRLKEPGNDSGYVVSFIGPGGTELKRVVGMEATYERHPGKAYVRAKVTYTQSVNGERLQYAAWTQPAFGDGRDVKASRR